MVLKYCNCRQLPFIIKLYLHQNNHSWVLTNKYKMHHLVSQVCCGCSSVINHKTVHFFSLRNVNYSTGQTYQSQDTLTLTTL